MLSKTHRQSGLNAALDSVRSANPAPVVELKSFALAGAGMARVIAEVTHTSNSRANTKLVLDALTQKLQGKMQAVPGSFTSLSKSVFTERVTGIVSVVRQAVPADKEMRGFRATASNMFMDAEENMWVLRKTQAGKILVKTTGIDDDATLVALLKGVSQSSASCGNSQDAIRMASLASSVQSKADAGDFVTYITQDNIPTQAFVVASVQGDAETLVVLAPDSEVEDVIKRSAITQVHNAADLPKVELTKEQNVEIAVAAARGDIDLSYLLSYYKRVFAASPAYFREFAARLNSHVFA